MTWPTPATEDRAVETWRVPISVLYANRFFVLLIEQLNSLPIAADPTIGDARISFAVWGGVAVELLLKALGLSVRHFATHDVEVFVLRDGIVWYEDMLVASLEQRLRTAFGLELGAKPLYRATHGQRVEDFEQTRVSLHDGDLAVNNVVVVVDAGEQTARFLAPTRTIRRLAQTTEALDVKPFDSVATLPRLSRRLTRTTAKVGRLGLVSGLTYTAAGRDAMLLLLRRYHLVVRDSLDGGGGEEDRIWLADQRVDSMAAGALRLWENALCETLMRIAYVRGASVADKPGVSAMLESLLDGSLYIPSIELLRPMPPWAAFPNTWKPRLADRCFKRLTEYQTVRAEMVARRFDT